VLWDDQADFTGLRARGRQPQNEDVGGAVREYGERCGSSCIGFASVLTGARDSAEMALATLQGAPVPGLSLLAMEHTMTLSHVPEPWLITHPPVPTVLPLYVSNNNIVPVDAQAIFTLSRVAGSIASVHINTDLGHGVPDILLQYWDEEGARAGLKLYNEQLDKQWARIINPRHLICEVKDLRDFKSGRVQGASKVLNAAVFQAEIIAAFSIVRHFCHAHYHEADFWLRASVWRHDTVCHYLSMHA
jgi:hypothetical protein